MCLCCVSDGGNGQGILNSLTAQSPALDILQYTFKGLVCYQL